MIQYAREIAALLKGCGRSLAAAFLLSGLSAAADMLCMVLLPVFLFTTLSAGDLSPRIPGGAALSAWFPTYPALVGAVLAVFVGRGALSLYVGARLTRLGETIRAVLTHRLAHYYLTSPYQEFTERSVSWALTMVGAYVGTFAGSVVLPLLRLTLDLMTLVAILAFLMILDYRIVAVTAAALVTVALGYYLAVRRVSERQSRRLSELQAGFSQHMSRSLHSPREVRIFQLQSHFLSGMEEMLRHAADAQARLVVIGSLPRVLGELLLIGLALGYLAYRTQSGADSKLLMSQLGLLGFAGLRLLPTFAQVLSNVSALRAGRHATGLIAKELGVISRRPVAHVPATRATAAPPRFESLELRDVSFAYAPQQRPVLDCVNLTLRRGESIGVVGSSGAGKSTLGDLILGLLAPLSGTTLVNGQPRALGSDTWWHTVGFVPQGVFLGNDSLLNNIAFGVPEPLIDRAKAQRAASMAQLDDVIRNLPKGLDSVIGDYGVRLSGGQRQRVAIARALYHDRQVLVLDEATSALDSETEKAVVAAIGSLRGAVTTFIIAHRRSTLESCDTILEIAQGRLQPAETLRAGSG